MSPHASATPAHAFEVTHSQEKAEDTNDLGLANPPVLSVPSLGGIPLKYLSLATLAVQNSMLTLIMHYSRVSTPPSKMYSAATAVLLNELLKGTISFAIAFIRLGSSTPSRNVDVFHTPHTSRNLVGLASYTRHFLCRSKKIGKEVFSPDCWKLSIPAILYVIQNHLQFVAISNLEAAVFQVSYQMKILTTAAFSVLLLRKKLRSSQWFALLFLSIGVGIVQIQSSVGGDTSRYNPLKLHAMNQLKGLLAVVAACFTSGLAGVYFEMVLKNSQGDIWIRNIQLSLFSLLPALSPVILTHVRPHGAGGDYRRGINSLFDNFGPWAWATVAIQVFGGLLTALVIKYSDNILKGFATSLSILISFLASVALFDFKLTSNFLVGSLLVILATWLYQKQARGATRRGANGEIGPGHFPGWRNPAALSPCCRDDVDIVLGSQGSPLSAESEEAWEQDKKLQYFHAQSGDP